MFYKKIIFLLINLLFLLRVIIIYAMILYLLVDMDQVKLNVKQIFKFFSIIFKKKSKNLLLLSKK